MLTYSGGSLNADRGRGKICQNLADVICERSPTSTNYYQGVNFPGGGGGGG